MEKLCLLLAAISFAVFCCVAGRVVQISYVGCYPDNNYPLRTMMGLDGVSKLGDFVPFDIVGVQSPSSMTYEYCTNACSIGGFPYFGVVSYYCFCGYYHMFSSKTKYPDTDCSLTCTGNSAQKCGGGFRNSVFSITYPDNKTFIKTDRPNKTVTASIATKWTIPVRNDIFCLEECASSLYCQAVIFNEQQLLCHLLRFSYMPLGLNLTGDYFLRG